MKVIPSGARLGAPVQGVDLSQPIPGALVEELIQALGRYGVLRYPAQSLTTLELRDFAARFGKLEVNVAGACQEPEAPEVMILSNIMREGKPIGLADAGQGWHTDMSYSRTIAFANVLYGIEIPQRDGRPLGNTEFSSMHAAYEDLSQEIKQKLAGMTVLHDFNKFWEM
ncbi:MAG: TauD/TfdA dioxygenase family protein, partial [Betaproteobacteria bacterium]